MKNKISAQGRSASGEKTNKKLLSAGLIGCAVIAVMALTSVPTQAATKTTKDLIVKSTDESDHTIKAVKGGHTYTIDATNAKLKKASKGNKTLKFSDIKDGDVLDVKGAVDSDHDVTATEVRDLSTTSSAKMYGIVKEINSTTQTVKIETTDRGELTVAILKSTSIKYDGKKKKFVDIREDDKVLVTGTWSHSKKTITKTKKFYILVKDDYTKLD
jgi:hypothetical protein